MSSVHHAEQRSAPHSLPKSIHDLRAALQGCVIPPDDPEYESARLVVNGAIDRRPALIIRPADTADVSLVVSVARAHGLELAIRGSGHSLAGHGTSDGGFVLDMSNMRGLHIDPQRRLAWAQAGLTAGQFTAETARHGLTTGFGDTGSVGIAGLTLGGGIGWLVRKHGLTIDDLLAVELVTADGERLRVDSERHPELFWALRGGGGNFGVVTRLQYRLHRLDRVLGGMLVLPADSGILRSFVAAAEDAPDELTTIAILTRLPPLPLVPTEHHGQLALMVRLAYAGDIEQGEQALAPLRALATPLADAITPMPYRQMYAAEGPGPQRVRMATRSMFLDELDEHAAATVFDRMQAHPSPTTAVQIRVLGGAIQVLVVAGLFGMFFLGALYMQRVLHYDAIQIGLAFLPVALGIAAMSLGLAARLIMRFGAKSTLIPGLVLVAIGLMLFRSRPVHAHYAADLLPTMILFGIGAGVGFPSVMTLAMSAATAEDSGLASGLVNTTQQVGGALGLAVLATLATSRTHTAQVAGHNLASSLTSGYHLAFTISTVLVIGAIGLAAALPRSPATQTEEVVSFPEAIELDEAA